MRLPGCGYLILLLVAALLTGPVALSGLRSLLFIEALVFIPLEIEIHRLLSRKTNSGQQLWVTSVLPVCTLHLR